MKGKIIKSSIFFISYVLVACNSNYRETIIISDVNLSNRYEILFELKEGLNVDKIKIQANGYIDDTVKIGKYFLLPEKVDTTFRGDWYAPGYILEYEPYKAKEGELTITFEFIVF